MHYNIWFCCSCDKKLKLSLSGRLVHGLAGLNPISDIKTTTHPQGMDRCFGASNRTRTCDTIGQKHGRLARLERFAILPVSSCSRTACICHRQRRHASRLTAACVRLVHSISDSKTFRNIKKNEPPKGDSFFLAPQTGLEPVTPSVRNMVDSLRLERS